MLELLDQPGLPVDCVLVLREDYLTKEAIAVLIRFHSVGFGVLVCVVRLLQCGLLTTGLLRMSISTCSRL